MEKLWKSAIFFIQQTQIDLCSEKSNKLCVSSFLQQGAATTRPEEELDRLTKKLVYDMNHPPAEDYFGISCYYWYITGINLKIV